MKESVVLGKKTINSLKSLHETHLKIVIHVDMGYVKYFLLIESVYC